MAEDQRYTWTVEVEGTVDVPVRRLYLAVGSYTVGSGQRCDLVLPADGVSRKHLRLDLPDGGGLIVEDLGSKNGTVLDGCPVERAAITAAARVNVGSVSLALVPLTDAGGHLAIAMPSGGADPPPEADSLHRPTTRAQSLEELLIRDLATALDEAAGSAEAAGRVLSGWREHLGLDGLELAVGDTLMAVDGETAGEPVLEAAGPDGLVIRVHSAVAAVATRLEPFFTVAAHALSRSAPAVGAVDRQRAPRQVRAMPAPGSASADLVETYRLSGRIARGDIPVLILGESGTGKEVLARWIHDGSGRADGPFLAVNCAALPTDLLEAELFGIERGVATGVEQRPGILERAHGGTVFLDELGDMALETQAKVLRVLESTTVYRVGGRLPLELDVRFVAATNRPLAEMVEKGEVRLDLYHRLAAFEVCLPPLRDRPEDIPRLAAFFLEEQLRRTGLSSPGVTRAALGCLLASAWPGNVRELQQEIGRAVLLLEPGEPLDVCHLSPRLQPTEEAARDLSLAAAVARAEATALTIAQVTAGDDQARALELLDISRATYYRKLREHGLADDDR